LGKNPSIIKVQISNLGCFDYRTGPIYFRLPCDSESGGRKIDLDPNLPFSIFEFRSPFLEGKNGGNTFDSSLENTKSLISKLSLTQGSFVINCFLFDQ